MDLRRVEKAWRLMWMRAIARVLPGPPSVTANWSARDLRTLFIRYERIGDMIMATGMIRVLAQASSRGHVDVLANPSTAPVLEGNPNVGKVFTLDRQSWKSYVAVGRQLRREKYDVLVDGRINNPPVFTSTPMLMLASRAPYRVGAGGGNNNLIYNVTAPPYDRVTPYIEASKSLAIPFGVDPTEVDWRPEIFLSDAEEREAEQQWTAARAISAAAAKETSATTGVRLLVNLSASEPKRRWQDEKFISVLRHLRQVDPALLITVIGLPAEWASVRRVAEAVRANAAATPRLRQALALVGTADLVFTPDTSISHAASAFQKPAVVLLKQDHHPYAPWNIPGEIVFWDGDNIHSLPPEAVVPAVSRLIAMRHPG